MFLQYSILVRIIREVGKIVGLMIIIEHRSLECLFSVKGSNSKSTEVASTGSEEKITAAKPVR